MTPIERDLKELVRVYHSTVEGRPLPSGAHLITIPNVVLPPGWNQNETTVRFIAPVGYPFAAPDCFWADRGLLLENGLVPQTTNYQDIPEVNEPKVKIAQRVAKRANPNITFIAIQGDVCDESIAKQLIWVRCALSCGRQFL